MDCRVIGERSDAVLRTAMPGNDDGIDCRFIVISFPATVATVGGVSAYSNPNIIITDNPTTATTAPATRSLFGTIRPNLAFHASLPAQARRGLFRRGLAHPRLRHILAACVLVGRKQHVESGERGDAEHCKRRDDRARAPVGLEIPVVDVSIADGPLRSCWETQRRGGCSGGANGPRSRPARSGVYTNFLRYIRVRCGILDSNPRCGRQATDFTAATG